MIPQIDFIHAGIPENPEYNSTGFRMDKELDEIDLDNYLLFAGSSHTEGVGVDPNQTFAHLVSAHMKCDCVNLAMGGGGIDVVEHNLLLWDLKHTKKPKATIIEWPIYQRYIKDIEGQDNLCPAGIWSNEEFIVHAEQPLYQKGKLTYDYLKRILPGPIVDVMHGKISHYTWNSDVIWHTAHDFGTDGEHVGPKGHLATAEQISARLGY
jgi:hypothetical protein